MSQAQESNRNQELLQFVQEAFDANNLAAIRDWLEQSHPSQIADLLESLPVGTRDELWLHISEDLEGDVLSHASTAVRTGLLEGMEPKQVAAATEGLESDDIADILQDLPEPVADEVLGSMAAQDRERVEQVIDYPEDTAGGLMNADTVSVRSDVDIDVVLRYLRLLGDVPSHTDSLMVVDRLNTYLGILPLSEVVTADPDRRVGEIMTVDIDPIAADTADNDVALLFEQRDLLSAAVVDADGKLIGRITVDDVVDVIREENDRTLLSAAGLDEEHDIFEPILMSTRRRALWLAINLATAFLAAWVIGFFDATIEQLVALAILMPVVASMGGIAGTQTLIIVIRGLAQGQVGRANAKSIMLRETTVGVINGLIWSLVVALIAALWFGDWRLGGVIGAAIVINLLVGALFGAAIPLILKRLRVDPALAGGVILTTLTDVVGFVAFLGLATIFLI
ncbi:MAG: magnesium transporter [Pseudomonadota bacterium]